MVVCRGPADLALIRSVPDFRHRFQRIHAWVTDSYFQAGLAGNRAVRWYQRDCGGGCGIST